MLTIRSTPWLCAMLAAALCACRNHGGTSAEARQGNTACIIDSARTLELVATVPFCASDDSLCHLKCRVGNATSCLALAYSADKDPAARDEALRLYRRGCLLGAANACTNHGASIWAGESSDDELACARRTFEKACAAREPFACGMVGRVMLESTTPPAYMEGRRYLERACDQVGGFSCRVLARHLESGKLGDYQPEHIGRLLSQACTGGDPDACGEPATAEETFH